MDLSSIEELATLSNDLEAPALQIAPEIAAVRAALEKLPNVRLVRMSGSGATFFGLFDDTLSAQTAAYQCRALHPEWWIEAVTLGDAVKSSAISCPG
jgi:4-diphosphocytidyl-2-C-methyl-D-erythritol kinase